MNFFACISGPFHIPLCMFNHASLDSFIYVALIITTLDLNMQICYQALQDRKVVVAAVIVEDDYNEKLIIWVHLQGKKYIQLKKPTR